METQELPEGVLQSADLRGGLTALLRVVDDMASLEIPVEEAEEEKPDLLSVIAKGRTKDRAY